MTPPASMADQQSVSVEIRIGSAVLRNNELSHVELREELGQHTTCAIAFMRDRAVDLQVEALLTAPVTVQFMTQGGAARAFTGVISSISQAAHGLGGSSFSLEVVSASVALEYRNVAYYRNTTLGRLAAQFGVRVVGGGADDELDFVQYGESDFAFLQRIADERGFFVRTAGEQTELHRAFIQPALELVAGRDLLDITVSAVPVNAGYKGSLYEPKDKKDTRLHGVRAVDPGWLGGSAQLIRAVSRLSLNHAGGGDVQVEEFPARAKDLGQFRTALQQKSARLLGTAVRLSGCSTLVTLSAGQLMRVASGQTMQLPGDFHGEYGLTAVMHLWDGRQYTNNFVATPWAGFTHETRPPRRLMPGPVTGFVVDNNDPNRMGRIRVRFFWQNTGEMTRWVRFATPHAGNERGFTFLPEVGDEVLVAFEQGDPERPIVLGCLWNGKDQTPQAPANNTSKRLVTRSGNTLHFSDENGKEVVELFSAQGKCYVRLSNDDGGKPLVTIRSAGDLSLEAEGEIRMHCESLTQRVSQNAGRFVGSNDVVKAGKNTVIKAGQSCAIEATNASVKAAANLSAVAGATHNIAGGMVQIQPPGLTVPPVQAQEQPAPQTVWRVQPTPRTSAGTSTNQRPTPRSKR